MAYVRGGGLYEGHGAYTWSNTSVKDLSAWWGHFHINLYRTCRFSA